MTAGDVGTIITANAGGFNMTGAQATLIVQLAVVPAPQHSRYLMTVQAGGLTATYVTLGTEFVVGGVYNIALEVVMIGAKYTSPIVSQKVNSLISP